MFTVKYTIRDREITRMHSDDFNRHEFIAQLRLPTHTVHVHYDQDRGVIHCFKYREQKGQCDFETFRDQDLYSLSDYIQAQFPDFGYEFVENT